MHSSVVSLARRVHPVGPRPCWMRPTPLANRPSMSCKDALVFGVRRLVRAVMRLGALPHGRLGRLQKHVAQNYQNFLEAV
jgi:hypothetical protein